jgi:predicted DNA-binding protein YlxM (UPF0122 family)
MRRKLIVLVADLIGSSSIRHRDLSQRKLVEAYQQINEIYKKDFYAPIKITRGDEIAGVLQQSDNLYRIADSINEMVYPVRLRFVFVKELLTAGLNTRDAAIIDGPAFKIAGELLLRVKMEKKDFVFNLGNLILDDILTTLSNLLSVIKNDWTEKQRKVVKLYHELKNQSELADKLGVSQQNIAKTLKSVDWLKVQEAEEALNRLLKNYNRY